MHSLVYLPAGFPKMTESVPAAPGTTDSDVLVNLSRYANDGTPNFEAVLDRRGVPRHVQSFPETEISGDFKPGGAPGHFTVSRPTSTPGRSGTQLVELDARFHEVRRYETQGLVNTDGHDSLLRADGSRILVAYEPNSQTHLTDAVIQEVDAAGNVVYTWNSAEHLSPAAETTTTPGDADYAHLNSIAVMSDGDILASFRHLSAVLKIAWHAHDGFQRGDIVWRLGGRHSDFDFVDDPYPSGPCAQHSATQLANGHILIYDNGSVTLGSDPRHCVDPGDPTGPTIERRQSRVTEYALDTTAGTATLVWSFQVNGRFTYFAGSARRLANGNTLVGWAAERSATATEVSPQGTHALGAQERCRVPLLPGDPRRRAGRREPGRRGDHTGPGCDVHPGSGGHGERDAAPTGVAPAWRPAPCRAAGWTPRRAGGTPSAWSRPTARATGRPATWATRSRPCSGPTR